MTDMSPRMQENRTKLKQLFNIDYSVSLRLFLLFPMEISLLIDMFLARLIYEHQNINTTG